MSADPDDKDDMVGYIFVALWVLANAAPFIAIFILAHFINPTLLTP